MRDEFDGSMTKELTSAPEGSPGFRGAQVSPPSELLKMGVPDGPEGAVANNSEGAVALMTSEVTLAPLRRELETGFQVCPLSVLRRRATWGGPLFCEMGERA